MSVLKDCTSRGSFCPVFLVLCPVSKVPAQYPHLLGGIESWKNAKLEQGSRCSNSSLLPLLASWRREVMANCSLSGPREQTSLLDLVYNPYLLNLTLPFPAVWPSASPNLLNSTCMLVLQPARGEGPHWVGCRRPESYPGGKVQACQVSGEVQKPPHSWSFQSLET